MAATLRSSAAMRTASRVKAAKSVGGQVAIQQVQWHPWVEQAEPDPVTQAKNDFSAWLQDVARNEKLFEDHVYKNPALSELDLHQHRARLFLLSAQGEHLIVEFLKLGYAQKIEPSNFFKIIQEQLDALLTVFNAWHGPLEAQEDVPQSFKDAIQELNRGELEPMDDMLTEQKV